MIMRLSTIAVLSDFTVTLVVEGICKMMNKNGGDLREYGYIRGSKK